MELRQLRYFEKASELLNFTEAAKSLFLSQSTLSQQIKQLEEELGILLFDRIGKRIVLTEAGESFLPYARNAIRDADSGKQIIQDLQGIETGLLRIGVTYSLTFLLTKALVKFSTRYPKIKVEITFATSYELVEKLENNKVDFILSLESANSYEDFETMPLFSSRLHLIVHQSHPFSGLKIISLEKLINVPLILPAKGFVTRGIIDGICELKNLDLIVDMELNDVHTIINLVTTGKWGTILTFASARNESQLVKIPIRSDKSLSTRASLFWAKGAYRKKSSLAFAKILSEMTEAHDFALPDHAPTKDHSTAT